ncbi:uncharacterized protein EV154DRAFT_478914 [Mucor mucedo]|uniref:uncharacterized protein n=1 Tax=Mucor mucedo TaxID=29922 RepID=UPI00221E9685|nr:uncharacterized protein EV154DRAFT_478914 [Mucor mucedo]KAI7893863.1 hypothetical protein EV154DRAFT_478914 [Mucor mucedo]
MTAIAAIAVKNSSHFCWLLFDQKLTAIEILRWSKITQLCNLYFLLAQFGIFSLLCNFFSTSAQFTSRNGVNLNTVNTTPKDGSENQGKRNLVSELTQIDQLNLRKLVFKKTQIGAVSAVCEGSPLFVYTNLDLALQRDVKLIVSIIID